MRKTRILIVDDHGLIRDGLKVLLERDGKYHVVGEARDGREAIAKADELVPDVILMDIGMPNLNGIEATKRILQKMPDIKILALSILTDKLYIVEMLKAGARGYVPKNAATEELIAAIDTFGRGNSYISPHVAGELLDDYLKVINRANETADESPLTSKETEILQLIAEGNTTKEIAAKLDISVRTVEAHRGKIFKKLDLSGIAELTKYAIRTGLITLD